MVMEGELAMELIVEGLEEAGPVGGTVVAAPLGGDGAPRRSRRGKVGEEAVEVDEGPGRHDLLWLLASRWEEGWQVEGVKEATFADGGVREIWMAGALCSLGRGSGALGILSFFLFFLLPDDPTVH